jgi:ubiquinone/menaquinone biosynthesis C-methylase UbiE
VNALRRYVRQQFWSRHASNWDDLHRTPEAVGRYEDLAAWLAEAAGPGARALDLGCGTGSHALALAARGLDVVGVDFVPGMLARAGQKADLLGLTLELVEHDLTRPLPFPDGSFGAVICSYVLQVIADTVAVLSKIRRVLGAGGWRWLRRRCAAPARPRSAPITKTASLAGQDPRQPPSRRR